jgi:hypothetical protein
MNYRTTNRTNRYNATPGFAVRIEDDTDLAIAFLVSEDDAGATSPWAQSQMSPKPGRSRVETYGAV